MEIDARIITSKILIIDDDPQMATTLEDLLRTANFSAIKWIADPRHAQKVYTDYKPDIVLLDLNMPHMDGFQVLKVLKEVERDSYLPVLVMTGEMDSGIRLRALNSGAKDFLNKPIDLAEALARIRNLLEVRMLHNDLKDQNVILEKKVEERSRQVIEALESLNFAHSKIKDAYIETIYRLTLAAEYKDEDTSAHIKRMSLYSATLAQAMGLGTDKVDLIFYSSPMHDIGKIGIPDRILMKAGALDAAEWEVMKTHTLIGAKILSESDAPILKAGEIIALSHHEHWDGSGYPYGLKGDAIPLEGRIVMMADIYDALRSKRSYKPPFDHKKTIGIMTQGDHRTKLEHFDPSLLELFKRISSQFEKVFDENQ